MLPTELPPDREIRVLCQHGKGAGNARNFGVREAKGEYVAFLDADDVYLPTKIERQLARMTAEKVVACHTSYFALSSDPAMKSGIVDSGRLSGFLMPDLIAKNPIAMPTAMVRRDVLLQYPFPDAPLCEDFLFWLNLAFDYPILGITDPLSVVSISPNNVAYHPAKQSEALRRVIDAVQADTRFSSYTEQIASLRQIANALENAAPGNR